MSERISSMTIMRRIKVGTKFIENKNQCIVTRVTDIYFDTLDTITRKVKVRNLSFFETKESNEIGGIANLL